MELFPLKDRRKRSILVVEDDEMTVELLNEILGEEEGHYVLAANDAARALALLRESHVDLIVLDYHLPNIDGVQLFDILKEDPETRDIPVIVLSGDNALPRFGERTITGYLVKPFDMYDLIDQVSKVFDGP